MQNVFIIAFFNDEQMNRVNKSSKKLLNIIWEMKKCKTMPGKAKPFLKTYVAARKGITKEN